MKTAFLTEMGFTGKIPKEHPNMRTEFAWMHALDADHYNIYSQVEGYDAVFVIFPKGRMFLSAEGSKIIDGKNPLSDLLELNIVEKLKQTNKRVYYIQEGPHWWWNDYELNDQINFYNMLASTDGIFAHNEEDVKYYKGLFPNQKVDTIPTLMIEDSITDITPITENKIIIGGNFARWYGGFESYIVADNFNCDIWAQTSHAMRKGEDGVDSIKHFPRMLWIDWMKNLSTFKYAIHMMPTVAAGTFALNCAYFGIPCIGNNKVDTQQYCHPALSVDVEDIDSARRLAKALKDPVFYKRCSDLAKEQYHNLYSQEVWTNRMKNYLA